MSSNFDCVFNVLSEKLNKGFEFKKEDCQVIISNQKITYRVREEAEEGKIYLEWQNNQDANEYDVWNKVSSWLFEENIRSKDIDLICDDFVETISGPKNGGDRSVRRKHVSSGKTSDSLFFANRLVNVFPELREEIFIEKECYSEFRGTEFTKNVVLPKIKEMLSEGKDFKKIERLFKLLGDLYKNSSLDIKSLITMGIMNNLTESELKVGEKYINDELKNAYRVSLKFKDKKFKPEKPRPTAGFISNALSSR